MTQTGLAQAVGVSPPTIYRIERGDPKVGVDTLARVATELGLEFDWSTRSVLPPANLPPEAFYVGKPVNPHIPAGISPALDATPIPTWEVDLAASAWIEVPICALDYDDPRQRQVVETGRFRLTILGRCMEPEYLDGQTIEFQIINLGRDPWQIGVDYCVCKSDGMGTFKRLVSVNEDTISLMALNQKEFPGVIVVARQELARVAKVAFRLSPPPKPSVPKVRRGRGR